MLELALMAALAAALVGANVYVEKALRSVLPFEESLAGARAMLASIERTQDLNLPDDPSAFWRYPDWDGPIKEPFWMRPLKFPPEGSKPAHTNTTSNTTYLSSARIRFRDCTIEPAPLLTTREVFGTAAQEGWQHHLDVCPGTPEFRRLPFSYQEALLKARGCS